MRVLTLTYYSIKRFYRSRRVMVVLLGIPFLVALVRVVFTRSSAIHIAANICPVICAFVTLAAVYIQHSIDETSGFSDGIRSCPISIRTFIASRVATWGAIFAVQMIVFLLVMSTRH